MEWKTIDSAPQDGSPVLVFGSQWLEPVPTVAAWHEYGEWAEFGDGATIWPAPTH